MPLRFGAFTFDAGARELRRGVVVVPLSPKAFRLLELLVDARPNPVPRETLYAALWPDVIVEPGNLHTLVSEVRAATAHDAIRTVHRVGYAFVVAGAVEESARFSLLLGDEEIPLRSGENVIGRDPRDAIVIHSPAVSRHHARLTVAGTTVTLEDLGSKNGTLHNGAAVKEPVTLRDRDVVTLGSMTIVFRASSDAGPTMTIR
ncbi:MAG: FHA domain-containing protein [Thermoanaerobaculia bacterium]